MPVRKWLRTDSGEAESTVETRGRSTTRIEDFPLAEQFDAEIDRAFDKAKDLAAQEARPGVPVKFILNWAVGKALAESELINHPALADEEPKTIWEVMVLKARYLARSDGSEALEWLDLRPDFREVPTSREGRVRGRPDHWEMCLWLAEQDLDDAILVFGGSTRNVWQMIDRKMLRPLVLRRALRNWLASLPPEIANEMTSAKIFPELMKALRERWPARGLRSAKQPIHYSEPELAVEIAHVAERAGLLGAA